jgi:predicted enzyme related to lactoylglutathione lyase
MRPVWCDLAAYRPATARGFYAHVLGWEIPKENYAVAQVAGAPVAGIREMPQELRNMGLPSAWTSYIQVPDLGSCVATAMTEGGTIDRIEGYRGGRMALVRDPLGASIALFQGDLEEGLSGRSPGARAGHLLITSDAGVAGFYAALLGWQTAPEGEAVRFVEADAPVAEMVTVAGDSSGWAVQFAVPDVQAAATAAMHKKGRVLGEAPGRDGDALWVSDMDGATFVLVSGQP